MSTSGKNWGSPERYHCNHSAWFQQNLWGKYINWSFFLAKHFNKCVIWYMLSEGLWDVTFKHALELKRILGLCYMHAWGDCFSGSRVGTSTPDFWIIIFLTSCSTGHYWMCFFFLFFLLHPSIQWSSTKIYVSGRLLVSHSFLKSCSGGNSRK